MHALHVHRENHIPRLSTIAVGIFLAIALAPAHGSELLLLPGDKGVRDLAYDGSVIVGNETTGEFPAINITTFIADRSGNILYLEPLQLLGHENTSAPVASGAGDLVISHSGPNPFLSDDPFVPVSWTPGSETEPLDVPGGQVRTAVQAVSGDGSTVVGSTEDDNGVEQAYRWAIGGEFINLPGLAGYDESRATAVSLDGRVVSGVSIDYSPIGTPNDSIAEATMWTDRGAGQVDAVGLGRYGEKNTYAEFISDDGGVVALTTQGANVVGDPGEEVLRWTESTGVISLGVHPAANGSVATGMSADGSILVGNAEGDSLLMFVWDEAHGMRDLTTVLQEEHGLDLSSFPSTPECANGWCNLLQVLAISGDGTAVGGRFDESGVGRTGWVAFLDRPLVVTTGVLGDFNGNAELDTADLDLLAKELQSDRDVKLFDVNDDDVVDFNDREYWVVNLADTYFGDANFDREFDSNDLVLVASGGKFEAQAAALWSQGDWNGNGVFTSDDLVLALDQGGYEAGSRPAAVPEPTSWILAALSAVAIFAVLPNTA